MAPGDVVRISVATSGTDFTAYETDFAALIRATAYLRAQEAAQVICPSGRLLSSLLFLIFRKIFVPSDPNRI
jgi:hypothetical protein